MNTTSSNAIPAEGEPGYMSCPRQCGVDVRGHYSTDLVEGACDTDSDQIRVGDRVRGRETSGQHQAEGVVTAIHYPVGLGYYQDEPNDRPAWGRNYTIDTGKTYTSGGPMLVIVECADKILSADAASGRSAG